MNDHTNALIASREWKNECRPKLSRLQMEAEGGCGVVGLAACMGLPGSHIMGAAGADAQPRQRQGRRQSPAVGLDAKQMKVPEQVLKDNYLVQVAYVDPRPPGRSWRGSS